MSPRSDPAGRAGRLPSRIENPADRESVVFLSLPASPDVDPLRFEVHYRAGGSGAHEHVHPFQHQRIEVRQGLMGFRLRGIERIYRPGEVVEVEPGAPHLQWNAGDEELVCLQEQRPAGEMEKFLRVVFGLVSDGRMTTLQSAAVLAEFSACTRHVGWRRGIFLLLGVVARALGYRGRPAEYYGGGSVSSPSSPDPRPAA
ncbi:MAG TPA: cupin domain-containing protein [Candidatus Binatia bacterium]|nr:cupin domain-containing protein [Candidatus Binatia bacterium]